MINLASAAKTARQNVGRTTSENDVAALAYALTDANGNLLASVTNGVLSLTSPSITGNTTQTGVSVASIQALSGAGAVDITHTVTRLTTSGASQALTLANGSPGQLKEIIHEVDGGSAILTPTTKTGFSTITFTSVGDSCQLRYLATRGWMIVSLNGATAA